MTSEAASPRRYTPRIPAAARREQILDAVLEVISEHGTGAVSVDGIARHLGFTRPVIYGLFTDADHMLRESLRREEERAMAQIAGVLPGASAGSPDAIGDAFRTYLTAVLAEPTRWRAILLPIGTPPALASAVRRGRQRLIDEIASLVATVAPAVPGFDSQLAARMLLTLAEESGRLVLTEPEAYPPERLATFAESLSRMAISALRAS